MSVNLGHILLYSQKYNHTTSMVRSLAGISNMSLQKYQTIIRILPFTLSFPANVKIWLILKLMMSRSNFTNKHMP